MLTLNTKVEHDIFCFRNLCSVDNFHSAILLARL